MACYTDSVSRRGSENDEVRRQRLGRRRALQGAGAILGAAAVGACGDDDPATEDESADAGGTAGASTGDAAADGTGTEGADGSTGGGSTGGAVGSDCSEASDLPPSELMANIDHIVVVCMENRSFDHYFGALQLVEGKAVNGLTGRETNPDLRGNPVATWNSDYWVVEEDPPHGWSSSRAQWNEGANDGFVVAHLERDDHVDALPVMGYHVREQLPTLYSLADNYVLCDRWHASVMSSTWPNKFYLHLATSDGQMGNDPVSGVPSIFDRCADAGVEAYYYSSNLPFVIGYGVTEGIKQISEFFDEAASGNLPSVAYLDPAFSTELTMGNDDHPPADIRLGQAFLATVYEALAQSPAWERTLLIITYDEHGGFYDHVSPPEVFDERDEFRQLGFRVPSLVIGPHVRRGCVDSTLFDHVSVPATITRRFDLEPLNERVVQTPDVAGVIDPAFLDMPQPPISLPPVEVRIPPGFRARRPAGGAIELVQFAERARLPPGLNRLGAHQEVMHEVLQRGVALGAVKLI